LFKIASTVTFALILSAQAAVGQQPESPAQQTPSATSVNQWTDDFKGQSLDPAKWERFTFEGPSGGKVEQADGVLKLRGLGGSRFGVRSVPEFSSDRFIVEAQVPAPPVANGIPMANAVLTVLFDSAGRNRIEWIWRSDGHLEAWRVKDGVGEQLDNHRLATKEMSPTLAIVRRGDQLMFVLNGEVGIQKKFTDLPKDFHVMLYGVSNSENSWGPVRVVTAK
jgi:hypothetical protein